MEHQLRQLKLSLWVKVAVVKVDGKNVWQATHENFAVVANAETPEAATKLFGELLQTAENKVAKDKKANKNEEPEEEVVEKAEAKQSEEVEQEVADTDKESKVVPSVSGKPTRKKK